MGWSGEEECIDEDGFYWTFPVSGYESDYSDKLKEANPNKKLPLYTRTIETTNSYMEEGYFASWPGAKESLGFKDLWHEDHYGNKYATKHELFKPLPKRDQTDKDWEKYRTWL